VTEGKGADIIFICIGLHNQFQFMSEEEQHQNNEEHVSAG